MKKLIFVILFLCCGTSGFCMQLDDANFSEVEKYSGGYDIRSEADNISKGKIELDVIQGIKNVVVEFYDRLKSKFKLMATLIVIALLSAVSENIKSSFKTGNDIVFYVFFAVIVVNGLGYYSECIEDAELAMDSLLLFINALYPSMLMTIAAGGGVASATALHPVLMVCGGFVMMIIKTIILPMLSIGVALQLSNSFSDDFQAKRMADFISGFIKWTVGIMMTLFVGVVSVSGVAAQSFDTVSVRATKYAIGTFIPMVGGVISDSFDLVLNGSGIIKNSIGLAGLLNILFLAITPCIKLLSVSFAFNICAALTEPVCNRKIVDVIGVFAKSAFTLFGILSAAACMFLLCTGVLISLG